MVEKGTGKRRFCLDPYDLNQCILNVRTIILEHMKTLNVQKNCLKLRTYYGTTIIGFQDPERKYIV